MSLPHPRRKRGSHATGHNRTEGVPVVLPRLVATVDHAGRISVTLDGAPVTGAPIGREAFGNLIDEILMTRQVPVRVEVIDDDGSTYTDVLTPPPPAQEADSPEETQCSARPSESNGPPELVEVTGDGFVPGEDVAVAVILCHSSATPAGTAQHVLETRELSEGAEVVLFGRVSGTCTVVGGVR